MRYVPADLTDWDLSADGLTGSETAGDKTDNKKYWAIKFVTSTFERFRIESGDLSYSKEYVGNDISAVKGSVAGADSLLNDNDKIKTKGGMKIFILLKTQVRKID